MSLAIDAARIDSVLLPDGEWHTVHNKSFDLDAYEYLRKEEGESDIKLLGGGQEKPSVPATGASWTDRSGYIYFCPLTSIVAVRYEKPAKPETGMRQVLVG